MTFKNYEWKIAGGIALLLITLSVAAFLIANGFLVYLVIVLPIIIYQAMEFYRFQRKAYRELDQFVESVHYRDFSRHFDVKHASSEIQPLRQGFNEINTTFKVISKERETQYQYLQKILELVDTGILSYEQDGGEVNWTNDSFKKLIDVPYLKSIQSLEKRDHGLYDEITQLKPGDNKVLTITRDQQLVKILITASLMRTDK